MQWSTDQRYLVYYNVVNEQGNVYLLDLLTGTLQTELTPPPQVGLLLRTWFDATHIYLSDSAVDTLYTHLYLLDIKKGSQQHLSNLSTVLLQEYGDFDSSQTYDTVEVRTIGRNSVLFIIGNEKHSLRLGSLASGTAKVFASIADGSQLAVAGWTTM